jgi:hypothetical protein
LLILVKPTIILREEKEAEAIAAMEEFGLGNMEIVKAFGDYSYGEFGNGITCYIQCKESYDALLDLEQMGLKVRDVDDEFAGAEFRDEKTKLLFAYDYEGKYCVRLNGGANVKVALYNELKNSA